MKFKDLRKLIVGWVNLYDTNNHFLKSGDVMFLTNEYDNRIIDYILGVEENIKQSAFNGAITVYLK